MKYYVTDTIDGAIDEEVRFDCREDAEIFIAELEENDRKEGRYEEGFYVIISEGELGNLSRPRSFEG